MRLSKIGAWVVAALLTALYAYSVVMAVGNLTGMVAGAGRLDLSLAPLTWTLLVAGLVLPPAVYALALLIARRGGRWARVLLLAAGLGVVAVVQLNVTDLVTRVISPLSLFQ